MQSRPLQEGCQQVVIDISLSHQSIPLSSVSLHSPLTLTFLLPYSFSQTIIIITHCPASKPQIWLSNEALNNVAYKSCTYVLIPSVAGSFVHWVPPPPLRLLYILSPTQDLHWCFLLGACVQYRRFLVWPLLCPVKGVPYQGWGKFHCLGSWKSTAGHPRQYCIDGWNKAASYVGVNFCHLFLLRSQSRPIVSRPTGEVRPVLFPGQCASQRVTARVSVGILQTSSVRIVPWGCCQPTSKEACQL